MYSVRNNHTCRIEKTDALVEKVSGTRSYNHERKGNNA